MNKKITALLLTAVLLGVSINRAIATITSTTVQTVAALGTGATTNYTIGFTFQNNSHIQVYLQDESVTPYTKTLLVYGSGAGKYTITGGNPGTTVVMGTAPVTTSRIIINRVTPRTQTVAYDETAAFPASDHAEAMDKMTMSLQELDASLSKKIGLATTSYLTTPTMPDPVANQFIAYNSAGTDLTLVPSAAVSSGDTLRYNGSAWAAYGLDAAFATKQNTGNYITALTGDVTAAGPGSVAATVNSVGGATAVELGYSSGLTGSVQDQLDSVAAAVISVGTIDSQTPSANGLTVASNTIYTQSASSTVPGMVNTGTQTFAGSKTFLSTIAADITGSAASATSATNAANVTTTQVSDNASYYPLMVSSSTNGDQGSKLGTGLTFNPSTNVLTTTTFSGDLSGNATTATTADNLASPFTIPSPTPSGSYLMATGTGYELGVPNPYPIPSPSPSGQFLMANGTDYVLAAVAGSGTVTEVSAAYPLAVASPTTTPNITFSNVAPNAVFAGPSPTASPSAAPSFRPLVNADLPNGGGLIATDWVAYTPTFSAGFGTPAATSFKSRRDGPDLLVQGVVQAGTVSGVAATMTIGYNGTSANVSIDTTVISTSTYAVLGTATVGANSATMFGICPIANSSSTTSISIGGQFASLNCLSPVNVDSIIASSGIITVNFRVPISGWSWNQ